MQVSILSRSEERLLPPAEWREKDIRYVVSILSRSEERLLLRSGCSSICSSYWFQSSAAPKNGCYYKHQQLWPCAEMVSILSRSEERLLPASHPGCSR